MAAGGGLWVFGRGWPQQSIFGSVAARSVLLADQSKQTCAGLAAPGACGALIAPRLVGSFWRSCRGSGQLGRGTPLNSRGHRVPKHLSGGNWPPLSTPELVLSMRRAPRCAPVPWGVPTATSAHPSAQHGSAARPVTSLTRLFLPQICAPADPFVPLTVKNHTEVLRCFTVLGKGWCSTPVPTPAAPLGGAGVLPVPCSSPRVLVVFPLVSAGPGDVAGCCMATQGDGRQRGAGSCPDCSPWHRACRGQKLRVSRAHGSLELF